MTRAEVEKLESEQETCLCAVLCAVCSEQGWAKHGSLGCLIWPDEYLDTTTSQYSRGQLPLTS